MRKPTLALITLLLLSSCSVVDVIREQKRSPVEPHTAYFTSIDPITAATTEGDPPVEKKFKNIRVLQGLPSSQLYAVMSLMANSLGVTCAHCHTENFEEESRIEKDIARQMIKMTRAINRAQFQGEPTVSCYTCHRGQEYPSSTPLIEQAGWQKMLAPKTPEEPLPDLNSVLARYDAAMGGTTDAGNVVHGRAMEKTLYGEITLVGGLNERASGRFELTPEADGSMALKSPLRTPPPAAEALTRYRFGRLALKQMYGAMSVVRRARVNGSDAVIVAAESGDDPPERLAFDASSGLLLRVERGTSTELGWVPEEISFSDYRTAGALPVPQTIRWARGDFLVTLRFGREPASSRLLVPPEGAVRSDR